MHIISSTILFGTGIGIAFFMWRSHFASDFREKLYAAHNTVLADYLFTLPAAITQLITGIWLVCKSGYDWTDFWLVVTYVIYVIAGACWLPVVWIQIRLKEILVQCLKNNKAPPAQYHRLFKIWFMLGWPAFIGLIIVFFMMVFKPT